MAENNYNIDQLLAELREKRAQIEGGAAVQPKRQPADPPAASPAGKAPVSQPAAAEKAANKAEEIRRIVEQTAAAEKSQPQLPKSGVIRTDTFTVETRRKATPQEVRSVRHQLTGSFDKLPPSSSGEFRIGHPAQEKVQADVQQTQEVEQAQQTRRIETEKHPIFTQQAARTNVIPPVQPRPEEEAALRGETVTFATGELQLGKDSGAADKGILNVKENVDESFREFFGDTVLIEHVDEKPKRRRETSVFEDGEGAAPDEYRSEEDTEDVLSELLSARGSAVGRCVVTGIAAVLLLAVNLLREPLGISFLTDSAPVYYGVNAALMLLTVLVNAKCVFRGVGRLFALRADTTSLAGFSALLALAEPVLLLISDAGEPRPLVCCVAATALLFCAAGEAMDASRIVSNFKVIAENPKKYASLVLADQNFTRLLAHDLNVAAANILIKRRTGFTDNFLAHSGSTDARFDRMRKLQPVFAGVSLLLGLYAWLIAKGGAAEGIRIAALCAALCAPFGSALMSALPIKRAQDRLTKLGAVLPGYSAAEEIAGANCAVVEGRELFPRDKVLLHGIKTFEKERVDKAILYAASVLIHSCDTMSHMFMKVIQGKTDMLFEADSVVYEEGLGFSFWVEQNRVLVGRRELLEAHEIEVPSRDYENRYTKATTRDAIYLAVAGKLYAMFVISYAPDEEIARMLHELAKQNVSLIVRTRDFIITPEKIARMYDIPRSMITLVRESSMQELSKKTEYTKSCSSSLTHIGSVSSFLCGAVSCHRLLDAAGLSAVLTLCGMALGALLAAALTLFGALSSVSLLSVLAFQLAWWLILTAVLSLRKY